MFSNILQPTKIYFFDTILSTTVITTLVITTQFTMFKIEC